VTAREEAAPAEPAPWQVALDAWHAAGLPGADGPDPIGAYRRWTHAAFGLDPQRPLHLAEKWATDAGPVPNDAPSAGSVRAGPYTLERWPTRTGAPAWWLVAPELPLLRRALLWLRADALGPLGAAVLARAPFEVPSPGGSDGALTLRPTRGGWELAPADGAAAEAVDGRGLLEIVDHLARAALAPWERAQPARGGVAGWLFGRGEAAVPPEIIALRAVHARVVAALAGG
jgi:hypothetical protein